MCIRDRLLCLPSDNVSYMFRSDMTRIVPYCNGLSPGTSMISSTIIRCPTLSSQKVRFLFRLRYAPTPFAGALRALGIIAVVRSSQTCRNNYRCEELSELAEYLCATPILSRNDGVWQKKKKKMQLRPRRTAVEQSHTWAMNRYTPKQKRNRKR